MQHIEDIAERLHQFFDERTKARDKVLSKTRRLIRHCAHAIRAIHRGSMTQATEQLALAKELVISVKSDLSEHAELYYTGYTQDAMKEFSEASIFFALVDRGSLPEPEDLGVEYATYLRGLAETIGELRRHTLDLLRHGEFKKAESTLGYMDEIFAVLITMDYPDAVTGGLRRLTDIARSITERTRGDLTLSLRQEQLEESLRRLEDRL